MRSFLFILISLRQLACAIGILNMFPSNQDCTQVRLPILVFAISVLILSSRMNLEIVRNMNKKLSEQKKFLFHVIDLNPNYIYAQDENGRYTLVNQSYAGLMGWEFKI